MGKVMSDDGAPDDLIEAIPTSHLLHRAQQLASDRFALLVGESELTLRQFVVMAEIAEKPGLTQAELGRATGIDRSTLGDMVSRLRSRGWLDRRESDADGRANALTLTETGLATLAAARQHAKAADAAILDALPRAKRKAFVAVLKRLSDHIDAEARRAEREARRQAKRAAKEKARARKKAHAKTSSDEPRSKRPRRQREKTARRVTAG